MSGGAWQSYARAGTWLIRAQLAQVYDLHCSQPLQSRATAAPRARLPHLDVRCSFGSVRSSLTASPHSRRLPQMHNSAKPIQLAEEGILKNYSIEVTRVRYGRYGRYRRNNRKHQLDRGDPRMWIA